MKRFLEDAYLCGFVITKENWKTLVGAFWVSVVLDFFVYYFAILLFGWWVLLFLLVSVLVFSFTAEGRRLAAEDLTFQGYERH